MPITPFLNGVRFDPETKRVLGVALELVCIALRTGDSDEGVITTLIGSPSAAACVPARAIRSHQRAHLVGHGLDTLEAEYLLVDPLKIG